MQAYKEQFHDRSKDSTGPDDTFAKVVGKEKPGRLQTFGLGVTLSDVYGTMPSRSASRNMLLRRGEEIKQMRQNFSSEMAHLPEILVQQNTCLNPSTASS